MKSVAITQSTCLNGLDGSNPLAFLTALGTLRTLTLMYPSIEFRMNWEIEGGAWRPRLSWRKSDLDETSLCDSMADWLAAPPQMELLEAIGDNLTLSPSLFRDLALAQFTKACEAQATTAPALDFLAAFGSDATYQPHSKDRTLMQDTALRTMSGAGHQHFIKFMREIIANTTSSHLYSTLFSRWGYKDQGRGMNLRWDPIDDRRYAMRWKNPSSDPAMTMRGANRLSIEAIPLFTTAPVRNDLQTTGFKSIPKKGTFWSWPIWESAIKMTTLRSLLQHPGLTGTNSTSELSRIGIATVFRSQRITVGKFRNFTPAKTADATNSVDT